MNKECGMGERKKTALETYSEQFDRLIRDYGKRQISAEEFASAHQTLRDGLFGKIDLSIDKSIYYL